MVGLGKIRGGDAACHVSTMETSGAMSMQRLRVWLPSEFSALMSKQNNPALVGMPEIIPVVEFRVNPSGRLPMLLHVMGSVPSALRVSA